MSNPNDLLANFQQQIKEAATQDRANYFLVHVTKVLVGRKDPNNFQVHGIRLDNGKPVTVTSKKSSSGQHLPQQQAVMRADKTSRVGSKDPEVAAYTAEYFHTYGEGSLCIHALMRANKPYERDGQSFASVDVLDLDAATQRITSAEEFDRVLLSLLKPWNFKSGPLAEDAIGNRVWAKNGVLGIQPTVHLRLLGADNMVDKGIFFGLGAVDRANGQPLPSPRLPTDDEILAHLRKSPSYAMLKGLTEQPGFKEIGYVAIPGMRVNVGRDALNGTAENYLGAPKSWTWIKKEVPAVDGNHPQVRGWRGGILHIKETTSGRKIAVDAAPSVKWGLTLHPRLTPQEQELRNPSQVQQAAPVAKQSIDQNAASRTEAPARAVSEQQAARPQQAGVQERTQPADESYENQPANHAEQFEDYNPEDIYMMEQMANDGGERFEDDIDDLLQQAEAARERRNSSVPRM